MSSPSYLDRIVSPRQKDRWKRLIFHNVLQRPNMTRKTLVEELNLRREFGISVVALRRQGAIRASLEVTEPFESGDALVIVGSPTAVRRVAALA